jgi:hypothetical protein
VAPLNSKPGILNPKSHTPPADAQKFKEAFEKVQKGGAKDMTVIKQVASLSFSQNG